MKVKIVLGVFLLAIGVGGGIIGKGVVEKRMAGQEITIQDEIAQCINRGSGIVKNFLIIHEEQFAEGKVITNPATGKKWVIISQERLQQILREAGEPTTQPTSQPTEP